MSKGETNVTRLVNLTRNTINVYDERGRSVLFSLPTETPEADASAEVVEVKELVDEHSGIPVPVVRHEFFNPVDVPDPEPGTVYVVGYHVLQAVGDGRDDLVAPDTSRDSVVRDGRHCIIGVRRFRTL